MLRREVVVEVREVGRAEVRVMRGEEAEEKPDGV